MNLSLAVGRSVTWLRILFALLFTMVAIGAGSARAHEVTPVIADFTVKDGQVALELRLNVEAFVAGINLDGLSDTNETAQAADYDELRALEAPELEPMVQLFAEEWLETFSLQAGGPVELRVSGISIPEAGDTNLPRASFLELTGEIPAGADSLRIAWPAGSGGVVLRQNGVEEPYTGYLQGGETSPPIPLQGGAAKTPVEAFAEYIPVGFTHILPKGLDHILFVLGLFFLSPRVKPLLLQVSIFTVAHTITLALGALGVVSVNAAIVEPLIALSIVFVAVENIFARKLHSWRTFVIFGFGLLHGLGFASVLGAFGLPSSQFLPALIGFNVGVELGQLAVIAAAYIGVRLWFGRHPKYRGRVAIPASVTIALIGGYWFAERVFM
ncbi:HupE/UreJ family protein [Leisingera sp. HS039]|uniref:HupE/UreJ family protein n=1 Tax=unclassified Leisingera TaxID=2614906 RepID=UPI001070B9D9|nr:MULTISPECIES: HupE/UreJ family protein [unclassified Leisingera]MBQ4823060.1 HupE/UreJ family protein [Leisingera sp. HS039]QBR36294.1 HupE/UreJ family protein [Leisingera sp. NJS201]